MGRSRRPAPIHLVAKLRQIRLSLNLTQEQMFLRLGDTGTSLYVGYIGLYEMGTREPPLQVLLQYARIAGVYVDVLIDDELELPARLPSTPKHEGVKRTKTARTTVKGVKSSS
ncbi:MAG: helix-turn-helix domain-containing protein [Pyrinomonadaceae bacterium MAG19_C2-C3]|nr:helix-turn-helix domain-containing protein [Pyrinomonadaceae bacterium MAG19_C2-C3]